MEAISSALTGMQRAEATLDRTAARVASLGSPESLAGPDAVDLSTEAVAMLQSNVLLAANVRMVQAADDMQKQVLNLLA